MTPRTIIFISYVLPPDSAIGAVRVGKFAEGLSRTHGWSIEAVVPRTSLAESRDSSERLGAEATVHKAREIHVLKHLTAIRAFAGRKGKSRSMPLQETHADGTPAHPRRRSAAGRLSDLMAVPDTHSGWIYNAFRAVIRTLKHAGPDVVLLSSGPPHSAHVAAAMARRRTHCPWVADLRDPWSGNPYNSPLAPLADRWNRRLERRVMETANAILCTTEPAKRQLQSILPDWSKDRIFTVPNGYDPEDLSGIQPQRRWAEDSRPVLLHSGSIYGKRDPAALLQALAALHVEAPAICPRVVFVGEWEDSLRARSQTIVENAGISHLVVMHHSVARREALELQAGADWLVLLGDAQPQQLQVPGKLFEYLALQRPILSLFPEGSPVAPYLQGYSNCHVSADPGNVAANLAALRMIARGEVPRHQDVRPVEELARHHQVSHVNEILESCLHDPGSRSLALAGRESISGVR